MHLLAHLLAYSLICSLAHSPLKWRLTHSLSLSWRQACYEQATQVRLHWLQAPGLRQLHVVQDQDEQPLMGSPKIQQDELSGGLILAPGSGTTASVSEPLADIAGGKSGTEAEIENPYDSMPIVETSGGPSRGVQNEGGSVPAAAPAGQTAVADAEADVHATPNSADEGQQGDTLDEKKDTHSDSDYSEQQQSQQASSGCKQS